jgi:ribosomal protein S18 acetylase RimI-like enzyme
MPDGIILRQARIPEEYGQIYALWQAAGSGIQLRKSDEADEITKKVQRDADLFLVALSGDEIVGAVLGGFDGRRGMMYRLAVAPAQRERGIGTALVDELERRLKARGCIRYYLLATAENEAAMRFYEKRGWLRMDVIPFAKNL